MITFAGFTAKMNFQPSAGLSLSLSRGTYAFVGKTENKLTRKTKQKQSKKSQQIKQSLTPRTTLGGKEAGKGRSHLEIRSQNSTLLND